MNDEQFQTAVQVAIAAMRATQPAAAPVDRGNIAKHHGTERCPKIQWENRREDVDQKI